MKINFFNQGHVLFPMRWLITAVMFIAAVLFYYDISGSRIFDFSKQEEWKSNRSGFHK